VSDYAEAVGHEVKLYNYGSNAIAWEKIALVAGGGMDTEMLKEIAAEGINTLVTGVTVLNDFSKERHDFAKEHGINIIGGTHYSSEKYACIAMCDYFETLELKAEFIADEPCMADL